MEKKAKISKLNKSKTEYKRLNNRNVQAFKPRGWDYHVRDTDLKGYYLKITTQGAKTYGIENKLGTSRKNLKRAIGSTSLFTEVEARTEATEWLKLLKQGIDPRQQVKEQTDNSLENPRLEEVHGLYVASRDLKPKTSKDYLNVWSQPWVAKLGKKPIKELTHLEITSWYNSHKQIHARQTEKTFTMIGASFKYAVALGVLTDNIIDSRVKPLLDRVQYNPKDTYLKQETELPAFLSSIVELSLLGKLNETHRDWILFAMLYGLRTTGASMLQWDWIDMDKKTFTIPAIAGTKLKQDLILPLTNLSHTMLMSRYYKEDKHNKYVFPDKTNTQPAQDPRKTVDKIIELTKEKLGNPEFHTSFHDWRSTWTNVAITSGIPLDERERIQGHSNKKRTSGIYSREVYEPQRAYLENHNKVLAKGMEHIGELFMMYVDDEGVDKDFIIENLTTIAEPPFVPEPQDKLVELDMFNRFAKDFKKDNK